MAVSPKLFRVGWSLAILNLTVLAIVIGWVLVQRSRYQDELKYATLLNQEYGALLLWDRWDSDLPHAGDPGSDVDSTSSPPVWSWSEFPTGMLYKPTLACSLGWRHNGDGTHFLEEVFLDSNCMAALGRLSHLTRLEVRTDRAHKQAELPVGSLEDLTYLDLDLSGAALLQSEVAGIAAMHSLRSLVLTNADLSDSDVATLCQSESLRRVHLFGSPRLSDATLEHLRSLSLLADIGLDGRKISDKGVSRLSELKLLEKLAIRDANVTGTGFSEWKAKSLSWLWLDGTPINDESVARIVVDFPQLTDLNLSRTNVTDLSVKHLLTLEKLDLLSIADTDISSEGAAEIESETGCTVYK